MPSIGTGILTANHKLRAIGISGDGDTASIGMGQFKHLMTVEVATMFKSIRHRRRPFSGEMTMGHRPVGGAPKKPAPKKEAPKEAPKKDQGK